MILQLEKYRDRGAIGALLDEYEKSIGELQFVIQNISNADLVRIVDHETKDQDCISIQTILSHVVSAGHAYIVMIRKHLGEEIDYPQKTLLNSITEYQKALNSMFEVNVTLFEDHPNINLEEHDDEKKIKARWGQSFDVEQMFEHAIVHILRHRRQIERFIIKIKNEEV